MRTRPSHVFAAAAIVLALGYAVLHALGVAVLWR